MINAWSPACIRPAVMYLAAMFKSKAQLCVPKIRPAHRLGPAWVKSAVIPAVENFCQHGRPDAETRRQLRDPEPLRRCFFTKLCRPVTSISSSRPVSTFWNPKSFTLSPLMSTLHPCWGREDDRCGDMHNRPESPGVRWTRRLPLPSVAGAEGGAVGFRHGRNTEFSIGRSSHSQ